MAQPVFEDHPLAEYLRDEVGESGHNDDGPSLPGIHPSFSISSLSIPDTLTLSYLAPLLTLLSSSFRQQRRRRKAAEEFAELFKYKLVSASLLSSNIGAVTPRNLEASFQVHSVREWKVENDQADTPSRLPPGLFASEDISIQVESDYDEHYAHDKPWTDTLPPFPILCSFVLFLLLFPPVLYTLCLLAVPILTCQASEESGPMIPEFYSQTLESLDELINASQTWDITTSDALSLLPPSSPSNRTSTPSPNTFTPSALAHSLHATLTHTLNHASTIRSLLTALARSPQELEMLSRMYGPPSPLPFRSFHDHNHTIAESSDNEHGKESDKRKTWASNNSPISFNRDSSRESHRRPLSLLRRSVANLSTFSGQSEEEDDSFHSATSVSFTSTSQPQTPAHSHNTTLRPVATPSSPLTRFTSRPLRSRSLSRSLSKPSSLHTLRPSASFNGRATRDPLSTTSLHSLRDQAKAGVRHTAGCLLGLRFVSSALMPIISQRDLQRQGSTDSMSSSGDSISPVDLPAVSSGEEDPSYWEDVQSILSLLRSALEDGSDRLAEAIRDHHQATEAALPSPPLTTTISVPIDIPEKPSNRVDILDMLRRGSLSAYNGGFAPTPSHISRFLRHIEAVQGALDDAWENLREMADRLSVAEMSSPSSSSSSNSATADSPSLVDQREEAILAAYDRLRRHLGVAFREGERGRSPLEEFLRPPAPSSHEQTEDLPQLIQDDEAASSTGIASPDLSRIAGHHAHSFSGDTILTEGSSSDINAVLVVASSSSEPFDLMLPSISEHPHHGLPPLGIEQVFEGDSLTQLWARERSKVPREERIRLAKLRRDEKQQNSWSNEEGPAPTTKLGPGGEVVQELKDVIWQVGEKRRKLGITGTEDGSEEDG